jgi:HAD superfamily hydrolase (TIGR01549 family)
VPIRAVLFDLFDTLVDLHMDGLPEVHVGGRVLRSTYGLLHDAVGAELGLALEPFAKTLGEVDVAVRDAMHRDRIEVPTHERFTRFLTKLGVDRPDLVARMTDVHMGRIAQQVDVLPHHVEVLSRLRARGARLGVCSNFTHTPTAQAVLARAGLLPLLDAVVISDEVGFRKPRPEIFRSALAGVGTRAEETLHVGDNLSADVGGATALGIPAVWITRRVTDPVRALREHQGPPPPHRVRDLAEVVSLLG